MSDGGKFCYDPIFSGGESYVIIEQCWELHVKNARYDVFQRISYNVNNTWLCITAPATVVKGNAKWDYVNLRPCAINDPLQRWIVKENSFWTADGLYRLKDTNMLHSFQMIAELIEYHSRDPLTSGRYFFDTTSNRDPFLSFSQRYPELDTNVPVDYANRGRVLAFASTGIMLPQYEWESSSRFTTRSDIVSHISSLINSAPGSIWLGLMRRQRADGFISGHAVPILRTSQGLVVIPTNMPTISLSSFIQSLAPTTDPN
ncbi:hypothetical protein LEP1GSC166_1260 [Leptospira kirschneri]|nr:hypothetical protein LEP1GSC166_1260 [Leptospira kirschneri]